MVTKTKNKNPFFCFFNFVRSSRDKKDVKIVWQIGETKLRQISQKKKTQILYFVPCLLQESLLFSIFEEIDNSTPNLKKFTFFSFDHFK